MQYLIKRNSDRIHKQDEWKKSWYAFFPYQTYFGKLTGFSEDIVDGGKGFGMHPHRDMEIITIPVYGAQTHSDSTGSQHTIDENSVQAMSAGTGIYHSEVNASSTAPFRSFQVWVMPEKEGITPRHEVFRFEPADKLDRILTVISPTRKDNSIFINQRAFFSLSRLTGTRPLVYDLNEQGNGVYIHVANGKAAIEGHSLDTGDAIGIRNKTQINITAQADTDLIFVEVPVDEIKF